MDEFSKDFEGQGPQETEESNGNIRVGLIGGPASGKTTMLLAMEKYAKLYNDPKGRWQFKGMDDRSISWLHEQRVDYDKKPFHEPTQKGDVTHLKFILRRRSTAVRIETQDRAGGDYLGMDEEMIEHLSKASGLIFLISPINDNGGKPLSTMIGNLLDRLDQKRNFGNDPLPHRVAVCISQYDDAEFFNWLHRDRGYLKGMTATRVKNTPFLPPPNVVKIIREWRGFPDGEEILHAFGTNFDPDNVNFYALSSIGFFRKPGSDSIDWDNCGNVAITGEGRRILNGSAYTPVNLFAPLGWILSDKKSRWSGY